MPRPAEVHLHAVSARILLELRARVRPLPRVPRPRRRDGTGARLAAADFSAEHLKAR